MLPGYPGAELEKVVREVGSSVASVNLLDSALFFLDLGKPLLNHLLQLLMNKRDYIISKSSSTVRESWWLLSTGIMEKNEKRLGIHNETIEGHLSPRAGQPFARQKWKSGWKWSGRRWLVGPQTFIRERKFRHCLSPSVHKGGIMEPFSAILWP